MTSGPDTATVARRTLLGRLRALLGPLLQMYARSFMGQVAARIFAVMVLVEAVFLAERFPIVFRSVFSHHADLYDTTLLFLCNSTQVFDLALAIAILLAVYWTTLRMRESRELLVLFAAGSGPFQLLAVVILIAFAGQLTSLVMSGVVDPATRFAERRILFDAEFRALRSGINTGEFYKFPNRVAFAPARIKHAGADPTRSLFVYEQMSPTKFRVLTADRALLDGPNESGLIRVKLGGFTSHTFSSEQTPAPPPSQNPQGQSKSRVVMSATDVTQQMAANELLTLLPRGSELEELTIMEELQSHPGAVTKRHRQDMRLLGERFARSLLCLLAPLMALAAICLTFRGTDYLVLPLACLALMLLNVTSGWLIKTIAPVDQLVALGAPAALCAALAALLLAIVIRRQGRLAQPQLARP